MPKNKVVKGKKVRVKAFALISGKKLMKWASTDYVHPLSKGGFIIHPRRMRIAKEVPIEITYKS